VNGGCGNERSIDGSSTSAIACGVGLLGREAYP